MKRVVDSLLRDLQLIDDSVIRSRATDWLLKRFPALRSCKHKTVGEGPRSPSLYGSWATEVCIDCGRWRRHNNEHIRKWLEAKDLLIDIARDSLDLDGYQ